MAVSSLLRSQHLTHVVVPLDDGTARLSCEKVPPCSEQSLVSKVAECKFQDERREVVRLRRSSIKGWKQIEQSNVLGRKGPRDTTAVRKNAAFQGGPWLPKAGNRGPFSVAALNTVASESPAWLTVQEDEEPQGITMGSSELGSSYAAASFDYGSESDDSSSDGSDDSNGVKRRRIRLSERSARYVEDVPEESLERARLKAEIHGEAIDEAEILRRARIALSNEGKRPWNKGRPHSEETKRKIRERTMAAMKDPETIKRLERKHAEGWVARRHIRAPPKPGWYKELLQQRRTQKLVEQQVLGLWRNANSQAARDSKDWLKQHPVVVEKKQRASPSVKKPRTAEHRQRISESIRAQWQEKKLRQSEALGNMKVLEARRRELAEEARALYKEAEAAAAALHAMPKSPAVLAALAETERVLFEAAKKVEQASGAQRPALVARKPRQRTVTAEKVVTAKTSTSGGRAMRIRRDTSNQPPRLGTKPPGLGPKPLGLGTKPPGIRSKPPGLGPKPSALGSAATGSDGIPDGAGPNFARENDAGSGSGLVMVEELEDLSNVAWGVGSLVSEPKLNGHKVKAAETYGSVNLDLGGGKESEPIEDGVL